jgi:hypothetical protein
LLICCDEKNRHASSGAQSPHQSSSEWGPTRAART